jgi:hypothetical protein
VGRWRWTGIAAFLDSWAVIKDILLTAGGLTLIMVEVFAVPSPSDAVIITGLAMSGIGASFHVGAILSGFIGKSSGSGSQPPPGSSPHSISPESSDEHGK